MFPLLSILYAEIKEIKLAELTKKAIGELKIKGTITEEKIDKVIEGRSEELINELSKFDNLYYKMEIDLADKVLEYIKKNRKNIQIK